MCQRSIDLFFLFPFRINAPKLHLGNTCSHTACSGYRGFGAGYQAAPHHTWWQHPAFCFWLCYSVCNCHRFLLHQLKYTLDWEGQFQCCLCSGECSSTNSICRITLTLLLLCVWWHSCYTTNCSFQLWWMAHTGKVGTLLSSGVAQHSRLILRFLFRLLQIQIWLTFLVGV